jgi:cell division protein FtsI (penicillin-binding protein 3)
MSGNSIKQEIQKRMRNVLIFSLLLASVVIGRILHIQLVEGKQWVAMIERKSIKPMQIPAERGNIYSDNGSLLATSVPEFKIAFDPNVADNSANNAKLFRKNINQVCNTLAKIYGNKSAGAFHQQIMEARAWTLPDTLMTQNERLKNRKKYPYLPDIGSRDISFAEKDLLEQIKMIKAGKLKSGFVFIPHSVRAHPFGNTGYRTIGVQPEPKIEGRGLEASMNQYLAGVPGKGIFEILKGGSKKAVEDSPAAKPVPGMDVYTTIDINIQDEAETALRKTVDEYKPNYATAVVMEVQTGEIKAMANLGYNTKTGKYIERINYALAEATTPGSTFKLPTMMALLEEGVKPTDIIDTGNGKIMYKGKELTDSHRGGFGLLTLQQVFEKSSNIGIMRQVMKTFGHQEQKYYDYLTKFKLTDRIGFQMEGEPAPVFYKPGNKYHSAFSMPWTAFGGIESKITPLQMLALYNAVANNGYWVEPIIVKHIKRGNDLLHDLAAKRRRIPEPIASSQTISNIRRMMEGVVLRGTAASQRGAAYSFAGKTGTCRKLINGSFQKGVFYTAFAGYFPAKNPKYSMIVVIDEPRGKDSEQLYAADVAAPVFRQIADHIFADDLSLSSPVPQPTTKAAIIYQSLQEDHEGLIGQSPEVIKISKKAIIINPNQKPKQCVVPDVTGLALRDALYVLENKSFRVQYSGLGRVKTQSLAAGSMAQQGSIVQLKM